MVDEQLLVPQQADSQLVISICGELEDMSSYDTDKLITGSSISL